MSNLGFNKSIATFGGILFFLMLFAPGTWQIAKYPFVIVLVILILLKQSNENGLFLSKKILCCLMISLLIGLVGLIRGLYFNNEGALPVETVMLIWPILFCLFITQIKTVNNIFFFTKVILLSSLAISIYTILFLGGELGWFGVHILDLGLAGSVDQYGGAIKYTLVSVSTLVYIFPFIVIFYFTETGRGVSIRKGFLALICLVFLCVLASGRRAILLSIPGVFVYLYFVQLFCLPVAGRLLNFKNLAIFLFISFVFLQVLNSFLNVHIFDYDTIKSIFNFTDNASNYIRKQEFTALTLGWLNHPFLGNGAGAYVFSFTRYNIDPWAYYELYYNTLLLQYGLLGLIGYIGLVGWLFLQSIKIIKFSQSAVYRDITIASTGSLFLFLCASGTNPYLGKFDALWTLFFQVALVNIWLLKKSEL